MTDITDKIRAAELALIQLDPILGAVIEMQMPISHLPREEYFFSLCRSIIGQQVSLAAAAAIFKRFGEITDFSPDKVLNLDQEQVKYIGLSRQKYTYLTDLSNHFHNNRDVYAHLDKLSDDEVIKELTAVKGIGLWSAQMYLMFTLVRLDVFAPDDAGLRRAIKQIYDFKENPSREELIKLSQKWQPYRTVASWHLWQSLNNTPEG